MGSYYDLLKKRRAVRSYTGERVPRETLERIARAARRGPNAGYSQGLRILVVDDPATIEAFTGAEADERERAWFLKAAAHIFVLTREQDYHDRYTQADKLAVTGGVEVVWPVPFWHVDAGAALMLAVARCASKRASAPASTASRWRRTRASASCSGSRTISRS